MRRVLFLWLFLPSILIAAQAQPFAEGRVDNTSVYLGQPLVYSLRVYLLEDAADSPIIEPSFVGFGRSSQRLESSVASETVNGNLYTVVEQNYLLYPLRLGTLTIDAFQVQLPETPFQSGITIRTEAVQVNVLPLPQVAPEGFRNAIGQYDIDASVNMNSLRSGDALTLSVSVSGSGNIEQILAPELHLPEAWRVFDAETDFQVDGFLFGRKTFSWIVFPVGEGLTEIPSIAFSYFNPQIQGYESRRTTAIALTLSPSDALAAPVIPTRSSLDAAPIALKAETGGLSPYPPLWFWGFWLIAPLIALGLWMVQRSPSEKTERPVKTSGSRALQTFRQNLKAAQGLEAKAAYSQVEAALFAYLSAKTGRAIDVSNAESFLKNLDAPIQEEILACLEEASTGRYAPIGKSDVNILLKRSLAVIMAVEKAWQ